MFNRLDTDMYIFLVFYFFRYVIIISTTDGE